MADPCALADQLPVLSDAWYAVADSAAVGASPVGVRVLGRPFVIWRDRAGALAAAADRCPHREAPLSVGRVDDGCLVCPYHGWTFTADGGCVLVPSAGPDAAVPPTARLVVAGVVDRYGLVWLRPSGPADPTAGVGRIPAIPQDADRSFRRLQGGMERWRVSVTRMVDNFCDVAHFPWVHAGTIGADVDPLVGPVEVGELDDGFTGYRYAVDVDNATGQRVRQEMTTGFASPFAVRSTTQFASGPDAGTERVLLLCSTPVDDTTSLFGFVVWRNADGGVTDEQQLAFDRAVGAEDKAMLERIPGALPLDVRGTVNVRSDRLSLEWRRRLVADWSR